MKYKNPTYICVQDGSSNRRNAISCCLYESEKFDEQKHLAYLRRRLDGHFDKKQRLSYDIHLVVDQNFIVPPDLLDTSLTIWQVIDDPYPGYLKHMLRYLIALELLDYDSVCFAGTDGRIGENYFNYLHPVIAWASWKNPWMGRFFCKNLQLKHIHKQLFPIQTNIDPHHWWIDEEYLWERLTPQQRLLVVQKHYFFRNPERYITILNKNKDNQLLVE